MSIAPLMKVSFTVACSSAHIRIRRKAPRMQVRLRISSRTLVAVLQVQTFLGPGRAACELASDHCGNASRISEDDLLCVRSSVEYAYSLGLRARPTQPEHMTESEAQPKQLRSVCWPTTWDTALAERATTNLFKAHDRNVMFTMLALSQLLSTLPVTRCQKRVHEH